MKRRHPTGKSDRPARRPGPNKAGKYHAPRQGRPQHQRPPDGRRDEPRPYDGPAIAPGQVHEGVLEMHPKGYGFLRTPAKNYLPQPGDPYVGGPLIDKLNLAEGLKLSGPLEGGKGGSGPRLTRVDTIEGMDPANYPRRKFDELTPVDPTEHIRLEIGPEPLTTRVMDLLTPIGRGQRGLIVAPPRTGKTVLLEHIAQAVARNYPEMYLVMLLVDERPEEVTEMRRVVRGEVVASSSDREATAHIRLAELVVERAKRLAEQGKDVFVLLDSLTRLARAYNKNTGAGGRTMSGGVDSRALDVPKRLFGTARAFEEGGSVTVMGTALIETGSRMDDVIFQEFKGTGNMELVLDRKLAERRVYPALDIPQSGTRKEERILEPDVYKHVVLLRRTLASMKPVEAMEMLVTQLAKYKSNAAFLEKVSSVK